MSRITVAQVAADVAALRADLAALTAAIQGGSATTSTPTVSAKPSRKPATKSAKPTGKVTFIRQATRKAYIAACAKDGYDLTGYSTKDCVKDALEYPETVPAGWAVGPRYTELFSA